MSQKTTGMMKAGWSTILSANDSDKQEELGILRFELNTAVATGGLKVYRYVRAASDTTVADGTVLTFVDGVNSTRVTSDISDSTPNYVAGVGIGAITADYYGWIQCYGYHSAILTDGGDDIAAGDALIVDPSVDGVCDSVAAGTAPTHKVVGWAVAADVDAANTVAGHITCVF